MLAWDMAAVYVAQNQRLTSPLGHEHIDLHQCSQQLEGHLESRLFPGRGKSKDEDRHCKNTLLYNAQK